MSLLKYYANKFVLLRILLNRPRLLLALLFGCLVMLLMPYLSHFRPITRYIIAWNSGALLYLGLVLGMMFGSRQPLISERVKLEDEGQVFVLIMVIGAAVASLAAIILELAQVKDLKGWGQYGSIALSILTILSSWFFMHTMFALHYAHCYYLAQLQGQPPGLNFPGDEEPDLDDFLYFSCIIGTSGQTADVEYTSGRMRRLGTVHCTLSFFFNATVLALMINIAAGLI